MYFTRQQASRVFFGVAFISIALMLVIGRLVFDSYTINNTTSAASPLVEVSIPKTVMEEGGVQGDFVLASASKVVIPVWGTIVIPKIRVHAPIESVGLTKQGAVGVPQGRSNVGWFSFSQRPGEVGDAVITGHFGRWRGGAPTVFNELHKLRKGDEVLIRDEHGLQTSFVVREIKIYGADDSVPEVFASTDGKAHVNLITCYGAWNAKTQSYPQRLVVYTDKKE